MHSTAFWEYLFCSHWSIWLFFHEVLLTPPPGNFLYACMLTQKRISCKMIDNAPEESAWNTDWIQSTVSWSYCMPWSTMNGPAGLLYPAPNRCRSKDAWRTDPNCDLSYWRSGSYSGARIMAWLETREIGICIPEHQKHSKTSRIPMECIRTLQDGLNIDQKHNMKNCKFFATISTDSCVSAAT